MSGTYGTGNYGGGTYGEPIVVHIAVQGRAGQLQAGHPGNVAGEEPGYAPQGTSGHPKQAVGRSSE